MISNILPGLDTPNNTFKNTKSIDKALTNDEEFTLATFNIDTLNILAKDSSLRDVPPITSHIFNVKHSMTDDKDYVPLDSMQDLKEYDKPFSSNIMDKPPEGKFSYQETQYLETMYGKEGIKQSIDENGHIDKKKFSSFLSSSPFPPLQLNSNEDRKNLFSINV